jgi:beta-keto acid cleavage enzyme
LVVFAESIMRAVTPLSMIALAVGAHVRVGIEDNIWGKKHQRWGPWDAALTQLRDWDPTWVETCAQMSTNPWGGSVLPLKTIS